MIRTALTCLVLSVCSVAHAYRVTFDVTQPMDHVFAYYCLGGGWSLFPVPVGHVPAGRSTYELGNFNLDGWGLMGVTSTDGVVTGINSSINPPDGLPFSIVFPGFDRAAVRQDLVNLRVNGAFNVPEAYRLENFALVNEDVLKTDTPTESLDVYAYDNATLIGRATFEPDPTTETLAPNSQTVNLGRVTKGNLASLAADDANAQTVCKYILPNVTSPFVRFTCTFTTTKAHPVGLELVIKAKSDQAGSFKIRGFLRDFSAGMDVQVLLDTALSQTSATLSGSAMGNMSDYLSNKNVLSKIEVQQTGPSTVVLPCVDFEFVNLKSSG